LTLRAHSSTLLPTRRSSDLLAKQFEHPGLRLAPASHLVDGADFPLIAEGENRLDIQQRSDKGRCLADPSPLLQIIQRVHQKQDLDRKSTRLNSSHVKKSYAV